MTTAIDWASIDTRDGLRRQCGHWAFRYLKVYALVRGDELRAKPPAEMSIYKKLKYQRGSELGSALFQEQEPFKKYAIESPPTGTWSFAKWKTIDVKATEDLDNKKYLGMQCGSHHQLNYTFHSETFQNNFIDLSFPEPHTVYLEVSTTEHLKRLFEYCWSSSRVWDLLPIALTNRHVRQFLNDSHVTDQEKRCTSRTIFKIDNIIGCDDWAFNAIIVRT